MSGAHVCNEANDEVGEIADVIIESEGQACQVESKAKKSFPAVEPE